MKIEFYMARFERLDYFIRTKSTGTPKAFAKKMSLSERMLYRYLSYMKDLGAPISFDREKMSYIYTDETEFSLQFDLLKQKFRNT